LRRSTPVHPPSPGIVGGWGTISTVISPDSPDAGTNSIAGREVPSRGDCGSSMASSTAMAGSATPPRTPRRGPRPAASAIRVMRGDLSDAAVGEASFDVLRFRCTLGVRVGYCLSDTPPSPAPEHHSDRFWAVQRLGKGIAADRTRPRGPPPLLRERITDICGSRATALR
jgi:hypothetical protein